MSRSVNDLVSRNFFTEQSRIDRSLICNIITRSVNNSLSSNLFSERGRIDGF